MKRPITTMLFTGSILIIAVYLSLINCSEGTKVVEYTGNVEGFVIDSLTRFPIDSAWIRIDPDTLNPPITHTDSDGYYFFEHAPGIHRYHYCGKNGYVAKRTDEYQVRKDATTRVDLIQLAPLATGRHSSLFFRQPCPDPPRIKELGFDLAISAD